MFNLRLLHPTSDGLRSSNFETATFSFEIFLSAFCVWIYPANTEKHQQGHSSAHQLSQRMCCFKLIIVDVPWTGTKPQLWKLEAIAVDPWMLRQLLMGNHQVNLGIFGLKTHDLKKAFDPAAAEKYLHIFTWSAKLDTIHRLAESMR